MKQAGNAPVWNGGSKHGADAVAGASPHVGREVVAVGDDQVLDAVGAGARELLVVLVDAPLQLLVQVVQQDGVQLAVVLSEHVHDRVQRVVARRRHPLRLLRRERNLWMG